jgi:protein-L-isoaspartate O-methyltransferase
MQMNAVETMVSNSPMRAAVQRHYEARLLGWLGGRWTGGCALEIGCGGGVGVGVGVRVILDRFAADEVVPFDLDERMVRRAGRRLAPRGVQTEIRVGDAAHI